MKKLRFFILGLFVSLTGFAQNDDGFNYQAIVRDANGDVSANLSMNMEISILQESVDGTVVFTETHAVTSNAFGLVNLSIGSQNPSSFALIDWANDPYFIKISIDGVEFGTSQLVSVPYALYAKTAENYNETDPLFSASHLITLTQEDIVNWDSKLDKELDPVFLTSIAGEITDDDIARWDNLADDSVLSDTDNDTKIQVEESPDEDIIRFDMGGKEYFRMDSGRLEVDNTGNSVFIGAGAGAHDDFTDNNNVAIGDSALYSNTEGDYNTSLGMNANKYNETGSYNVALGYAAGKEALGSGGVFLGYQAGKNETGSNKLYIDNSDTIAPLIYGDFVADSLRINGDLEVSGTLKIEGGSPGAGYVLTSDANGLASWSNSNTAQYTLWADSAIQATYSDSAIYADTAQYALLTDSAVYADTAQYALLADSAVLADHAVLADRAVHADTAQYVLLTDSAVLADHAVHADTAQYALWADSAIYADTAQYALLTDSAVHADTARVLADADGDTKIQVEESLDEDIIRFDMGGTEFFRMDSGRLEVDNTGSSVFIGAGAGAHDDFTDNNNVAIGDYALYSNMGGMPGEGEGNAAIGFHALYSNTIGSTNTAIGFQTLYSNTDGDKNTATGTAALYKNETGDGNTATGNQALMNNREGHSNIATGYQALANNTTGNRNTATGYMALSYNRSGNYNTALGFEAGSGGETLHSKSGGVFLGYKAGYFELEDNKLYISNDSLAPLIYGDFAEDSLHINGHLKVLETIQIEGGSPEAGYVLTSLDTTGLASWSNSDSAIYAYTAEYALLADSAVLADHAFHADTAKYTLWADSAIYADTAK
ncbi:MAG: hypothetical protein GY834_11845, partial [Bacteroidetes bacterium]|nr:hypothetical protein [Bacteroidota bacterium]